MFTFEKNCTLMSKPNHLILLEQLKKGDEKTIHSIYVDNKNGFLLFANRYNLSSDDLLDVYQDSIVALCENAKKGTIDSLESSITTYLFSIGKYMIYKKLKSKNINISIDYDHHLPQVVEDEEEEQDEEEIKILRDNFKKLGEKCQKVLRLFYYEEKKLDAIQIELEYTNKDVLKSQKSRCLKQLKDLIKK
jgi:RNA polymerase sigma factor (sigma-70 family)